MTRRKTTTATLEPTARPKDLPAPYLAEIGREDLSVHELDETEPTETLCGKVLAEGDWEGFATLPLDRKSCETCLRVRRHRDELGPIVDSDLEAAEV